METETVETAKVPVHCSPGDAGLCVNSDGTLATPPQAVVDAVPGVAPLTETVVTPEPLPVEKLEVATTSSCGSCNATGMSDGLFMGCALLVPLFIKAFRRL